MEKGDFFVSTGEVLMPEHTIRETSPGRLSVTADVRNTLPLQFAELVWGDGEQTHRQTLNLETSHAFEQRKVTFEADAPNWRAWPYGTSLGTALLRILCGTQRHVSNLSKVYRLLVALMLAESEWRRLI